ncbi:hypothetical protein [Variovorax sp. DAIF25]|uniref:hypothetical protein n=1 Tax=Variovorax sp. DAIF25 TaxID=3080983 RepID=UPI003D6A01AC
MNLEDPFRAIEEWSGCAISPPLRALLSSLGDTTVGDLAHFYAPADLRERNETYETRAYCPGWLTIGDDGGGSAIVVAPDRWPTAVYLVGHGSMSRVDFVEVAEDLHEWVGSGCKL